MGRPEATISMMFQSTPPREGRPLAADAGLVQRLSFNPRPRVRGDVIGRDAASFGEAVSIHAPA